jgi:hypothetical protein
MARRAHQPNPRGPTNDPSTPTPAQPFDPSPTFVRRGTILILLLSGIALAAVWFGPLAIGLISLGPWGPTPLVLFLALAGVAVVLRPVRAAITRVGEALARRRRVAATVVVAVTFIYLLATARGQGRPLRPYVHDEFSYLIQAHQFARLHGWMPPHPLAPFFDSFQLLNQPVYASAYFPGTALAYVPGIWLGVPPWVTSLCVASLVAGLLFRITVDLFDGPLAVAAVLLLWTDGRYRTLSVMTLAQMPLLMWGLAATVAWLSWRSTGRRGWAVAIAVTLGFAGITRPVDALCFAVPIGVDLLISTRPKRTGSPQISPVTAGLMAAAVLPFLALQLSLDHGITGRWTTSPFRLYADRDYPGSSYGFQRFDPAARPASPLPQKQKLYDDYRPVLADHTWSSAIDNLFHGHTTGLSPARIELTLARVPSMALLMLLPLMPVALAGLTRRRAVVVAVVPLFWLGYVGYVFFFPHYTVTAVAAVVVAVLIGGEQLPTLLPAVARPWGAAAVPVVLVGLAVAALPQFDPTWNDDLFASPLIADVDRQLAAIGHRPAIVLFTYDPKRNVNEEPVYNADVAGPDDAAVVRAHDLGRGRNTELFAYYAAHQPDRFAYRYDEASRVLEPLGPVTRLSQRSP